MWICAETMNEAGKCRSGRKSGISLRMMLSGFVAANLLQMPAIAEVNVQGAKTVKESGKPTVAKRPARRTADRVSPYTIANRRHAKASRDAASQTKPHSVQRPDKSLSHSKR